jgi:hypothetical protein
MDMGDIIFTLCLSLSVSFISFYIFILFTGLVNQSLSKIVFVASPLSTQH